MKIHKLKAFIISAILLFTTMTGSYCFAATDQTTRYDGQPPNGVTFESSLGYAGSTGPYILNALASAPNVGIGTPISTWPVSDSFETQSFRFEIPSNADGTRHLLCTANPNVSFSKSGSGYAELDSINGNRSVSTVPYAIGLRFTYSSGSDYRYLTCFKSLPTGYTNSYYCIFTESSYVDQNNQCWVVSWNP